MEIGDLELAVLRAVRNLGPSTSGAIYEEVRKTRDVAYTSVTTTLYRLVDKDLVALRKASEKKVYYRIREGRAYRKVMASMVDRVVKTFGGAAVSYILANPGTLPENELEDLVGQAARKRGRESKDG